MNQDAFLVADLTTGRHGLGPEIATHEVGDRGTLLAVSDGAGEAGATASELALAAFFRILSILPDDLSAREQLRRASHHTAKYLYAHYRRHPEVESASATLTGMLVRGHAVYVAQIGDSRAYLLRGDRAEILTHDQTLLQALIDSGTIDPERYDSTPPDMLLQTLGTDPSVDATVTTAAIAEGDVLLVCSDGLSDVVTTAEMLDAVGTGADLDDACRRMVELALDRGAGDNLTIVLGRVDALASEISPDEAITWSLPNVFTAGPER